MSVWKSKAIKRMVKTEWPWTNMISLVKKFKKKNKIKVLEIGCGSGCNIPFFMKEKSHFSYYAIDNQEIWIKVLKKKYPKIRNNLFYGNFLNHKFNQKFDLILDRCSMTHNSKKNIIMSLKNLKECLNKKGIYVGVDWWSTKHSNSKRKNYYETKFFKKGDFAGVKGVFFSSKSQMLDFFKTWKILYLAENITKQEYRKNGTTSASWDIVAENSDS